MTGYIVSIPVFFDAAFIILVNLVKSISRKGKIPFATLVCALSIGLITTHAMVVPTPGPVAVAGTMGLNIGFFLLYSIIVSIPATFAGGIAYGKMLGRRPEFKDDFAQAFEDEATDSVVPENSRDDQPSGQLGIFLIILPILIILAGTIITMVFPKRSVVYAIFAFVGNKNIALLIGVLVSLFCLRKYLKESFNELVTNATTQSGSILAITGAGGAFGQIITNSGIGKGLANGMMGAVSGSTIVILLMAYVVSLVLRAAQGSTTVALVTTSAIFASIISGMPNVSPVLVAIAICAGGIGLSLPNDSGFWVINRFGRFSVKDTIKIYTGGGTIASVTAMICVIIISLFQGILPGLF
jgi:GntP family gluconate:H+ symporter